MEIVNYCIENNTEYNFNESQSLFNITEEEYNIVVERKQSPDKILLVERLRYIISHEYRKYCNSKARKAPIGKDIQTYFNDLAANPYVRDAQETITKLLKFYNSQNVRIMIESGVYYSDDKLLFNLNHGYWIDSLLFYILTHKTSTTAHRSFLNIINRYYRALSNIRYIHKLDIGLEEQLNVLYPFVIFKTNDPNEWSFSNDSFVRRVIIALYKNQEHYRNDLFRIKRLLDSLEYTSNNSTNALFEFNSMSGVKIQEIQAPDVMPWIITVTHCNGKVEKLTFDAEAIKNIRNKTTEGNDILKEMTNGFKNIYKDYANKYYDEWANILKNGVEVFGADSWYVFLKNYLNELGHNRFGKDVLEPDFCYDYLVYRHVMSKPDIVSKQPILDNQLTDRLIDLLHKNQSPNQLRLYEDCFSIIFIRSEIRKRADVPMTELPQNDPIWIDSLEFLNPILNESLINTTVMSVEQVKGLLKKIISNKAIYESMRSVPKTFTIYNLNINAHILLKIIGLLRDLNKNWNGSPLCKNVSAGELAARVFKIKDDKKIGNMRKHISGSPDSKFTEEKRRIAIDIINSYWEDIFDKKS